METGLRTGFQLPGPPAASQPAVQPLRAGGESWLAGVDGAQAAGPGAEGWALRFDRVIMRDWRPDGGEIQDVGRAQGQLAFVRRGDGGRCVWMAGRFEATIRFVGPPAAIAQAEELRRAPPMPTSLPVRDDTDRARRAKSLWERQQAIKEGRENARY
ncbi:MAG: hypothetical protein R3F60_21585 [bacterium]